VAASQGSELLAHFRALRGRWGLGPHCGLIVVRPERVSTSLRVLGQRLPLMLSSVRSGLSRWARAAVLRPTATGPQSFSLARKDGRREKNLGRAQSPVSCWSRSSSLISRKILARIMPCKVAPIATGSVGTDCARSRYCRSLGRDRVQRARVAGGLEHRALSRGALIVIISLYQLISAYISLYRDRAPCPRRARIEVRRSAGRGIRWSSPTAGFGS
jgi:hypothetical protein